MPGKLRKAIAIIVSAAMLLGLTAPPAYAHAHASTVNKSEGDGANVETHDVHSRHHCSRSSHSHDAIEHPSEFGGRHVHWHVLIFDFTFPVDSEVDSDDGGASVLAVLQKFPTPLVASTDLVPMPLLAWDGSTTADRAAMLLGRREVSRICPVVAGPLCDTARFARSGVLIA